LILANLVYGVITLNLGALLKRMLYFRYIQALWVMPMYLFSGVFFNIEQAPVWMQWFANIFPLYHVLEIVRPMVLGRPVDMSQVMVSFVILVAIFIVGFYMAYKQFQKRLFD
jgi:lipooligosaccharide transport system permease protein